MPTPTTAPVTIERSGSSFTAAATKSRVEITVHVAGATLPIILAPEMCMCASSTWGEMCKVVVEKYLTTVDPSLILNMLGTLSSFLNVFSENLPQPRRRQRVGRSVVLAYPAG